MDLIVRALQAISLIDMETVIILVHKPGIQVVTCVPEKLVVETHLVIFLANIVNVIKEHSEVHKQVVIVNVLHPLYWISMEMIVYVDLELNLKDIQLIVRNVHLEHIWMHIIIIDNVKIFQHCQR